MKRDPRTLAVLSVRPGTIDRDYRASFLLHLLPPCRHFTLCTRYCHLVTPRSSHRGEGWEGEQSIVGKKNRSIADALSIIIHSLSRNESRVESIIAGQGLTEVQAIENNRGDRRACTDRAIEIATERYR